MLMQRCETALRDASSLAGAAGRLAEAQGKRALAEDAARAMSQENAELKASLKANEGEVRRLAAVVERRCSKEQDLRSLREELAIAQEEAGGMRELIAGATERIKGLEGEVAAEAAAKEGYRRRLRDERVRAKALCEKVACAEPAPAIMANVKAA